MLGVAACCLLLAMPASAQACTAGERADIRAAMRIVASMRSTSAPAAADSLAVLGRARRSCADARFARAMAVASRSGSPQPGQRRRVLGIDLVGIDAAGGAVWRLDTVRLAQRLAGARTDRGANVLRAQLRAAGFGRAAITWSADPTVPSWNAELQSAVGAVLARSPRASDRALAAAGARAFAPPARQRALATLGAIEHLRIANRVSIAAASGGNHAARAVARSVAVRVFVRVRAARARSWSRIGGEWSTLAAHRALVAQSEALLRRVPHSATAGHVGAMRATLTTPPGVDFSALPTGEFYPWPRDAAFDSQSFTVDLDEPATLTLTVYAPDGAAVRSVESAVLPGPATISWDGAAADGSILGPGEYRYNVDATDRAGNRVRVAGLDQFTIARDTTPPAVRHATVRHLVAGGTRRLVVSWDVEEVHSPNVRTWLVLTDGTRRMSFALHQTLRAATVRRVVTLAPGSWRAGFVASDGSGNRTRQALGTVVVR